MADSTMSVENEISQAGVYSAAVQEAIDQLFPNEDALFRSDFEIISYINTMFPNEQSLAGLDETISQIESQMAGIDAELAELVQEQSSVGADGHIALEEAKSAIRDLFTQIREIKAKTDVSESMVKEITRDIKQLDVAKKNLTAAIGTLHHLHILITGVERLNVWIESGNYADIASELPAILNVLILFDSYASIPQVKELSDQVCALRSQLSNQIVDDFKTSVQQTGLTARSHPAAAQRVTAICRCISSLAPTVQQQACSWYIEQQLKEYKLLYDDTEDCAWLDKIDERYVWMTTKLTTLEQSGLLDLFPTDWQMGRRIAYEWCTMTRYMLANVMQKRQAELDSKLLAHAIRQTTKFEQRLCRRFPSRKQEEDEKKSSMQLAINVNFQYIIWKVFDNYMSVFIDAHDKNLQDFIEQAIVRYRDGTERPNRNTSTTAHPLMSAVNLFKFYKKIVIEATELSTNSTQTVLDTAPLLKKYLREYSQRCLQGCLPKVGTELNQQKSQDKPTLSTQSYISTASAASLVQYATSSGILSSFLRDGEAMRLSNDDQFHTCCILATADWSAETAQQLSVKLKEKVVDLTKQQLVDLSNEQENFYQITSTTLSILSQDLEAACDAPLLAMTKISWSTKESVGDESPYIRSITQQLRSLIPTIRDYLCERKKYFGHLCLKFVQQFLVKYVSCIFRCKPCSVQGAEQLLLDAHSLKTFFQYLPCVGSTVAPKPPVAYTKIVNKTMGKVEMILKMVMTPTRDVDSFCTNYIKLLPESDPSELQKVLEMKSLRKTEQVAIIDRYRTLNDEYAKKIRQELAEESTNPFDEATSSEQNSEQAFNFESVSSALDHKSAEARMKALEDMVKRRV